MSRKPFVMATRLGPKELARRMNASARQAKAVDLFVQGWTYRKIALELGYAGPSGVKKAIEGAIAKAPSRSVESLRLEVEERSRVMLEQLMPVVVNKRNSREDRLAAIDRVIRIDKELRNLHGLDAPTRNEHTGKDGGPIHFDLSGLTDEQLDRLASGDPSPLTGAGAGGEEAPSAGPSVEE